MIFIALGTMVGLPWNVLMSKTITTLGVVLVYKDDYFCESCSVIFHSFYNPCMDKQFLEGPVEACNN